MSRASQTMVFGSMLVLMVFAPRPCHARGGTGAPPQQAKLIAADAAKDDTFGSAIAISGDTAIVGAPLVDHAGFPNAGAAYVFVRNGNDWSQQAKLTAPDPTTGGKFGGAVAIRGDTVLVGAAAETALGGNGPGSTYVFVRNGTNWSQQAKLTATDAVSGDRFGASVALWGDTALVGASAHQHSGQFFAGAAYLFVRNGTTWSQQAKLTAFDAAAGDQFGTAVALAANTAIVGAPMENSKRGSVYVFDPHGAGWSHAAKLHALAGANGDQFGTAIAIEGETMLVGAGYDDHFGKPNAGSAYAFVHNGTTWGLQAVLMASDAVTNGEFGQSVALSSSGDTAAIGAPGALINGITTGSAYVFVRNGTSWMQQAKLAATDAATGDQFGSSVAVRSGGTVAIGAHFDDHAGGSNAGSAYTFHVYNCQDAFTYYGAACPGASGLPTLTAAGCATPGDAITITMANATGGAPALLLIGAGSGSAPIHANCALQILPLLPGNLPFVFPPSGTLAIPATLPVALPVPLNVHLQTLIADPGGAGGVAATNPVQLHIQ